MFESKLSEIHCSNATVLYKAFRGRKEGNKGGMKEQVRKGQSTGRDSLEHEDMTSTAVEF